MELKVLGYISNGNWGGYEFAFDGYDWYCRANFGTPEEWVKCSVIADPMYNGDPALLCGDNKFQMADIMRVEV